MSSRHVALTLSLFIVAARCGIEPRPDLVRWVPAETAEAAAAKAGKPLLYEFSAEWCGPCHILENQVFRDARLAGMINDGFVPVKVVDRRRETGTNPPEVDKLQRRFRVRAFPTVVIVRPDSEPAVRIGFRGRSDFEEFLRGVR